MKAILVLACVAVAAAAPEPPTSGGYDYPAPGGSNFIGGGNFGGSFGGSSGGVGGSGGNVYRHVYIHTAPDSEEDRQARVIRIPGSNNKHVNIVFVKTPSQSSSAQTEVILPEQEQQKTIVYVLAKKFDPTTDLKLRAPRPTSPAKPEVYFIRYKNNEQQQGSSGTGSQPGDSYGPPPPQAQPPRPQYGLPSF